MTKELIDLTNKVYAKWCDENDNQTTVMQLILEATNKGYIAGLNAANAKSKELERKSETELAEDAFIAMSKCLDEMVWEATND